MSRRISQFRHEFVEFVPERIEDGVLYVSIPYATTIHRCACGCGQEVVTPLSPTDWRIIYDGKTVSLDPSIGSWSFDCQSHYFIRGNRILWCDQWSKENIELGRARDSDRKDLYYGLRPSESKKEEVHVKTDAPVESISILDKIRRFWPF
jgi:hypothetical protein